MNRPRQFPRVLLSAVLLLAVPRLVCAERAELGNALNGSVILREDTGLAFAGDQAEFAWATAEYPHILDVFLRLENKQSFDVRWVADSNGVAIRAELTDSEGHAVPEEGHMSDALFNPTPYVLPYGSRLDWYVSDFSTPMRLKEEKSRGDDQYLLSIHGHLWLVSVASANTYTLRLRLYGFPWQDRPPVSRKSKRKLLLKLPPTKIEVAR